jgi:hypothetical protein
LMTWGDYICRFIILMADVNQFSAKTQRSQRKTFSVFCASALRTF